MYGKKIIIALIFFSLAAVAVKAQSPRAFETSADKAFESKDYYSALKYYEKVMEIQPQRLDILSRYADAAREFGAMQLAEASYEKILLLDSSKAYPNAYFWLGVVKKSLSKYDDAIQSFESFKNTQKADASMLSKALLEMEACEWAMEEMNNPDPGIIIERLPEEPNTANSEFAATQRGDTMYYSSFRQIEWGDKHYPERPIIKVMEAIEGREVGISPMNDPQRHTAHTAFSPDGKWMIFNNCDYVGEAEISCELFYKVKEGNDWSEGKKLPASINMVGYTATQPNIALEDDGGYALYFVSDRLGGKGGLDIWKSRFSYNGVFANPENIAINTTENDITPFFDNRTKFLYFSTLGYRTIGGYDIYKSALNPDGWQVPEHLDIPFNSSYNDVYFAMQADDWAYFSSNRTGSAYITEEACCYDIYKGTYLSLKLEALAFSKLSGDPLDEVIFSLVEVPQDAPILSRFSNEVNHVDFDVKRDKRYMIIASKEGYRADTFNLMTNILPPNRKFVAKLYLEPTDFALNVRTFNQFYKSPLKNVSIRLLEISGRDKEEANTKDGNETSLNVKAETQYSIIANKPGFFPDTVVVGASELKPGAKVTKNLFLTPSTLGEFLPISLYFDNDQPDPRTRKETTQQTYEQSYEHYITRREEFIENFTKNMKEENRQIAEMQLKAFFEEEVKGGFMKLDYFAQNLDLFLENDYKVEIMVKGFASPLANNEYNLALTKRRIASVLNYFRKVRGGMYNSFLISGQLAVTNLPLGETSAKPNVSDDWKDKRSSVFSVDASRERRAEILEIRLAKKFNN